MNLDRILWDRVMETWRRAGDIRNARKCTDTPDLEMQVNAFKDAVAEAFGHRLDLDLSTELDEILFRAFHHGYEAAMVAVLNDLNCQD